MTASLAHAIWPLICTRHKAFAMGIWRCADRYDGLPRRGYPSSRRGSARYRFAADKPIKTVRQNGGWINRRLIRHDGLIGTHAWRLIGERHKAFAMGIWRCADRYDGLPRRGYPSSDVIRLDNVGTDKPSIPYGLIKPRYVAATGLAVSKPALPGRHQSDCVIRYCRHARRRCGLRSPAQALRLCPRARGRHG